MVTEEDLTLGAVYTMQHTGDTSQNCTLETCTRCLNPCRPHKFHREILSLHFWNVSFLTQFCKSYSCHSLLSGFIFSFFLLLLSEVELYVYLCCVQQLFLCNFLFLDFICLTFQLFPCPCPQISQFLDLQFLFSIFSQLGHFLAFTQRSIERPG